MRQRLGEWALWVESWKPKLGFPNRVPFVGLMKPTLVHDGDGSDYGASVDAWAMQVIDASIESLPHILSCAIYAKYLRQGHSDIAHNAELRLIRIVQQKGLLL